MSFVKRKKKEKENLESLFLNSYISFRTIPVWIISAENVGVKVYLSCQRGKKLVLSYFQLLTWSSEMYPRIEIEKLVGTLWETMWILYVVVSSLYKAIARLPFLGFNIHFDL